MSDSAVRANESTDEPSNQVPWLIACPSCEAGMVTVFTPPMTSVYCRSMWRTWSASTLATRSSTASLRLDGGKIVLPLGCAHKLDAFCRF
jgi:hypothetical protein